MKILFRKLLWKINLGWLWTKVGLYNLFSLTPWGGALIVYTLQKYIESDWYKKRSEIFTRRQVLDMYYDNDEWWFFKRRLTRKEKWGIFIQPFTYIKSAQKVVHASGLEDYI